MESAPALAGLALGLAWLTIAVALGLALNAQGRPAGLIRTRTHARDACVYSGHPAGLLRARVLVAQLRLHARTLWRLYFVAVYSG